METFKSLMNAVNESAIAVQALEDEVKTLVNMLREVTWSAEAGVAFPGTYRTANEILDKFKDIPYERVDSSDGESTVKKVAVDLVEVDLPF